MSSMDPRTPVVVGVGVASQRADDPVDAVEALELMVRAVDAAADDSGRRAVLDHVGWIGVSEGTWSYRDPGRLLAARLARSGVHTVRVDVGVTQQELIARACLAVQVGGADVALVVGGEAKYRALRAAITGVDAPESPSPDEPDEVVKPKELPAIDIEITRNSVSPTTSYALIERSLAHHDGLAPDEHRQRLADLWGGFAAVAAANPNAWDRSGPSGEDIVTPSAANRMIAPPYTKQLCSQWNVDQAAALLVCSVEQARALGVPADRWVFPHSSAVVNHSTFVPSRPDLWDAPGARISADRALALAGIGVDDLDVVDLYSCFPVAVQILARSIGLGLDRPLTVTGGMTFAGGPLNNYVLQAMVELVDRLRSSPESYGLSTSVSGSLVKQAWGIWSARAPVEGFRSEDCTETVAAIDEPCPIDAALEGAAEVVSWTVAHERGVPTRGVVLVESDDGRRSIVASDRTDDVAALLEDGWIGRRIHAHADGSLDLP